jgi:hydroxymethylglutaryl-CoA lyase
VTVYEVGPRDGLQNEPTVVATEEKLRLIDALAAAGLPKVEITSFVSPKWIPALADNREVGRRATARAGTEFTALVPNRKGLEGALESGLPECAVFLSASETHNRKNINRSIDDALADYAEVIREAMAAGMRVRAYLSMVWGCPFEGDVPIPQVARLAGKLADLGCYQISLGDTVGWGTPLATWRVLEAVRAGGIAADRLALHMHDTRGTALANCIAGLEFGVTTFDAAVGGLGGCPYAKGATGNLATEDLVAMLHGMAIETGVDLDRLVAASRLAESLVGRPLPSRYLQACAANP